MRLFIGALAMKSPGHIEEFFHVLAGSIFVHKLRIKIERFCVIFYF